MKKIIINTTSHPFFPAFWEIYEPSFPLCERRSLEDQELIFSNETYHLEAWIEADRLYGFIGWWDCPGLRYVEHYAVHPEYRSSGYGSVFLSEWIKESDIPVLLEIEPVTDDISRRRQSFYKRLGLKENDIRHWHPPYHRGMDRVELWLMSYPDPIQKDTYNMFIQKQRTEIIPPFF